MKSKSAPAMIVSTRHSWNLFAGSILCMLCSGTIYWFPALAQGLKTHLHFSENQVTWVLAAANAGALLGFVSGPIYKRVGARKTIILGAALTSALYFALGLLVRHQVCNSFILTAAIAICIDTSAFLMYGAAAAASAAAFPKALRGRIMGFLSVMYGMSAGVCGVLQAAFFPSIDKTEHLLYFIALLTATPIGVAAFVFPDSTTPHRKVTNAERTPLLPAARAATNGINSPAAREVDHRDPESGLIRLTYLIAVAIVVDLQFGAYAAWTKSITIALPGVFARTLGLPTVLRAEVVSAAFLLLLLGCFALLPLGFRERDASASRIAASVVEEDVTEVSGLPFRSVLLDVRYQLMLLAFFALPGCATVTSLIQAPNVVASRMFPGFHNQIVPPSLGTADAVDASVRALVVAFSACNMMARLVAGSISDWGGSAKAREVWRLHLVQADIVLVCVALIGVAFLSSWKLIVAVGLVGYAHGTYFAIAPTQISNWFGVDGFPLHFAIACVGIFAATVTVAPWMATVIASSVRSDSWIDIAENVSGGAVQRFCSGVWCYAPTFVIIAMLNCILLLGYLILHKRIVAALSRSGDVS